MNSAHPKVDVVDGPEGLRFIQHHYVAEHRMPPHAHEDAASLNFCLRGTLHEFRDQQTFLRGPSSLSLMPAGVPHANRFPAGVSTFLIVLGAPWVQRVPQVSALVSSPLSCDSGRPAWIAGRMHREFLRPDDLTPLALEGMLLELLAELARGTTQRSGDDAPGWLQQATDYLHTHFADKVSSEAVAAAAGVHPAHLMRAFRRHHGCTVGEYVRGLRVEYALRLLQDSDASLAQVALDAGFCDQGHFSRSFKAHTGVSPGEFRRASGRARRIQGTQR
jgi:AraC family transcriptional regulator